jgi:hypothetical protein
LFTRAPQRRHACSALRPLPLPRPAHMLLRARVQRHARAQHERSTSAALECGSADAALAAPAVCASRRARGTAATSP